MNLSLKSIAPTCLIFLAACQTNTPLPPVATSDLSNTPFNTSITFNPSNLNQAYLTTETNGLWTSSNMNIAPPSWTNVSTYQFRQPERVFFNPYQPNLIWVTSFGSGMMVGDMLEVLSADNIIGNSSEKIIVYPNPTEGKFRIQFNSEKSGNAIFQLINSSGQIQSSQKITFTSGKNDIQLSNEKLSPGIYIGKILFEDKVRTVRLVSSE